MTKREVLELLRHVVPMLADPDTAMREIDRQLAALPVEPYPQPEGPPLSPITASRGAGVQHSAPTTCECGHAERRHRTHMGCVDSGSGHGGFCPCTSYKEKAGQ